MKLFNKCNLYKKKNFLLGYSLGIRNWRLLTFLFLFSLNMSAQTYEIRGTVTDSLENPLPRVNVIILETKTGDATDLNGSYSIKNVSPGTYTVEFSIIGFETNRVSNVIVESQSIVLNTILKEKPVESEQVIVTASKYEQKISELPVSAEIVDAQTISMKNFTDLEDVLRYVPGVNMTDDQISIRGSSGYSRGAGSRVLLAIDGIPFYTGDTGETIWEVIPLTQLKRVEIIKGAASSLYGSTAIGGVINVITKDISPKPSTYLKTFLGFYDEPAHDEWDWSKSVRLYNGETISHSNRFGDFGFSASFTRLEDLGYRQNNFSKKYIGFFKGSYDFSASSSIMVLANTLDKRSGNFVYWKDSRNALIPPESDLGQQVNTKRYMFGSIFRNVFSNTFFINVKAGYYYTNWDDGSTDDNHSITNLFRGEVQANTLLNENLILISGIEAAAANVKSNLFGNPDWNSLGAYSQADLKFKFPLIASIGIRYDYNKLDSIKGSSAVSPKLGINYKFSDKLILRSSLGTGFRAPSPAEAFTSTSASGITVKPNPNLKSEKNLTFEIGTNYKPNEFFDLDLTLFHNEYYDFIEPGVDPADGLIIFDNVTRARIQGYEVNTNINLLPQELILSLNYTYLWARDIEEMKALKYRPHHLGYAKLDYLFDNFELGADFRYWSRVEEIDYELIDLGLIPNGDLRVAVYVLDLRASYNLLSLGIPLKAYFNINNALNYNYVELIGNIAQIRNYSLSLELIL
jgi:outer membrane receptor for ferrienterochelin and colicins